ncbi:hypothetical protein [uncultured Spirosoma sp.]|uniref:hypothetical protein n=1 Tax=uncultured Spirosoma sp. TaxID=278208 RepID=UPI000AA8D06D|nr:hypothetical protein [uncultured Spirosoma sp.]
MLLFEAGRVVVPIGCTKVMGSRWYYALQTTGTVADWDEWSETGSTEPMVVAE